MVQIGRIDGPTEYSSYILAAIKSDREKGKGSSDREKGEGTWRCNLTGKREGDLTMTLHAPR